MAEAKDTDQMSPDESPGTVERAGVRRVNNMPLFILGGIALAFLLVMMLVASDRAAKQNAPAKVEAKKTKGSTKAMAKAAAGDQGDGLVPPGLAMPDGAVVPPAGSVAAASAPASGPEVAGGLVPIAKPDPLDAPPAPPARGNYAAGSGGGGGGGGARTRADQDAQRIAELKVREFEEAVKAKTSVSVSSLHQNSSGSRAPSLPSGPMTRDDMNAQLDSARRRLADLQSTDPAAAYQARLAQARAISGGGAGGGEGGGATPATLSAGGGGSGNGMSQFNGQGDRWRLDNRVERPRAPFVLEGGVSVIPALLWGGINSELPGNIFAQVSQDVYDTPTGQCLLIPQGTKLAGAYSSNVVYGQSRVLAAWQRLVFPDGKTMDIGAMPASDGAGYAGMSDQVNNHYVRIFGSALLMSGVIAGTTYSQRNAATTTANGAPTASSALSEALGQELGQVTAQMISKNLAIAPTLEIRPGFRLNVVVTKDLVFPKCYHSFDY